MRSTQGYGEVTPKNILQVHYISIRSNDFSYTYSWSDLVQNVRHDIDIFQICDTGPYLVFGHGNGGRINDYIEWDIVAKMKHNVIIKHNIVHDFANYNWFLPQCFIMDFFLKYVCSHRQ